MGNVRELPTVTIARLEAERDELADALAALVEAVEAVTDFRDPATSSRLRGVDAARGRARVALSRVFR